MSRKKNKRRDDANCHTPSFSLHELDPLARLLAVRSRDGWQQDGAQPTRRGATAHRVGGAPARPPAAAPGGAGGGGDVPYFDAMKASAAQMDRKLDLLGVSMPLGSLKERVNERRGTTTNELGLQLQEAQERKRQRKLAADNAKRVAEIDQARKDGKLYDAMAEVRERLKPPQPPPPPPDPAEPMRAAESRARAAKPEDVARLDRAAFQRYLELRFGIQPTWPM